MLFCASWRFVREASDAVLSAVTNSLDRASFPAALASSVMEISMNLGGLFASLPSQSENA